MSTNKKSKTSMGEIQRQKSPAEFFAENQAIAGFDNFGKALYTSVRELVENGLDACESIGELPNISLHITEYTQQEFNKIAGIGDSPRKNQRDTELFETKASKSRSKKSLDAADELEFQADGVGKEDDEKAKKKPRRGADAYFQLTVRDSGCGMAHDAIPNLFGRVLSGSKYGVRQTRGKFGLGAKMALIWARKSSGQPIRIRTAHRPNGGKPSSYVSSCVLDIDIYKNEPKIIEHSKKTNTQSWTGTEVSILIAGNWTTYKSRIVQYFQQLAIITPYANLTMVYDNHSDPKRSMRLQYDRRSEQMPEPAKEVKHHPSSVNNLVVQQLVRFTKTKTLIKFLTTELSCVSPSIAKRLIDELGKDYDQDMHPNELTDKQVTRLVQLLRQVQLFRPPDGSCLSPLGEYNLSLGIQKVLEPDLIATARDKPSAFEGHPFIIEAAVSLGGKDAKEGISVVRFANRIPLLFEGGADVSSRVATSKIRWANYKVDHKRDKIGVFVSIVSTKIPFKGTSKEYIGDDATEIQLSVKRAIQSCCQQLRVRLAKRNALKDAKERKNRLTKYVPDIGRSLFGILDQMKTRHAETNLLPPSPTKRLRVDPTAAAHMIRSLQKGDVTEAVIKARLEAAIDNHIETEETVAAAAANGNIDKHLEGVPIFIVPLYNLDDSKNDIVGSLFTFRPLCPIRVVAMNTASN
ncbi:hypothetical protein MPSEU_001090100 [Mayamaea pseudoterrestris]|nr:hypothetical protein MPSEU_001090100 [Mayamaea pseudoterrestris]